MTRRISDLPDALIGSPPVAHGQVGHPTEEARIVDRELATGPSEEVARLEQLSQRVELELPRRAVADPHRCGVPVPTEVAQGELGEKPLPGHPVHDLEVLGPAGTGSFQPALEGGGLTEIAQEGQGSQREGGVTDPGEAVVPVPSTADPFGQRRRPGGHHGPRGCIGQRLEHQGRSVDAPLVVTDVTASSQPRFPEGDRLRQPALHVGPVITDAVVR